MNKGRPARFRQHPIEGAPRSAYKVMRCDYLFPTPIFVDDFPEMEADNARILAAIPTAGTDMRHSNLGGMAEYDVSAENEAWEHGNYQWRYGFLEHPACQGLVERIKGALESIRGTLKIVQPLLIGNAWVNVYRREGFIARHIHPRSYLSGVYYVKVDDPGAALLFHTPLTAKEMSDPDFASPPEAVRNVVPCDAVAGRCVFFPAWLHHSTIPVRGDGERVSIAFNIYYTAEEKP